MHTYWDLGNQIYWDTHRERIVYAIGPGVEASVNLADGVVGIATSTAEDPVGWTTTHVEVGGTSELNGSATQGIIARVTPGTQDNDGGNYQAHGQTFRCVSSMKWYVGMQFTPSEASQSDLLFGVCISDTTLLGDRTDGVYMECLDAATSVSVVAEKDSSETQTDSLGTLTDATKQTWEMFWTGTNIHYYIDGALVANVSSGEIPDDEALRVSLHWLNGSAGAKTLDIHFLRGFAWA